MISEGCVQMGWIWYQSVCWENSCLINGLVSLMKTVSVELSSLKYIKERSLFVDTIGKNDTRKSKVGFSVGMHC